MEGMGVIIHMLGGRSQEDVNRLKANINCKIESLSLNEDKLYLKTEGNPKIEIWDGGQSCCESRYMVCDDNLNDFIDATLLDITLENGPDIKDEMLDCHEVQFLKLKTDRGIITVSNHNEHNGYYGGFWLDWK